MYRLEAATSRLEDMAMSLDEHDAQKKTADNSAALEPQASERPTPTAPAAPAAAPLPPQIEDFDTLISKDVGNFVQLGQKIGGLVAEQV
jgi:adenylyl cyclase-associated protein